MASLRSKVIRLAHAKPELRPHLLPLLKTAVDIIPIRPFVRNTHTETVAGTKYVLSTHSGSLAGDTAEEPEVGGPGAREIRVRSGPQWKYLWVYDTDKQEVSMWRVTDGNLKEVGGAREYAGLIRALDKKNEINRVTHQEYNKIEREMSRREDENARALEQWVEELKTDTQRKVDDLVREYFDREVRPAMDRALSDVERGVTPLGFKADPEGSSVERQAKAFVTGKLYDKLLNLDRVDAYVARKGIDLKSIDIQATQWARDDVWMDYIRSALR
jgi:hypothetical protein